MLCTPFSLRSWPRCLWRCQRSVCSSGRSSRQHFGRVSKSRKKLCKRFHSVSVGCPKSATSYIIVKISRFWSDCGVIAGTADRSADDSVRWPAATWPLARRGVEILVIRFYSNFLFSVNDARRCLRFPGKNQTISVVASTFPTYIINFQRIYGNLSSASAAKTSPNWLQIMTILSQAALAGCRSLVYICLKW